MLYTYFVKRLVRRSFDNVNNHRWDELLEPAVPNVHHRFGGAHAIGGERHDKATLRRWFERLGRVLPNLHLQVNWPGGTQTMSSGPNCSITVRAPSGNISLIGGTTGGRRLVDRLQDRLAQRYRQRPTARLQERRRACVGLERPADLLQLVDGVRIRPFGGQLHRDRQLTA